MAAVQQWWDVGLSNHVKVEEAPLPPPDTQAGPFPTRAEAQTFANKLNAPGSDVSKIKNAVPNPLSGIDAIGDFFNRLTDPNTWLRVAEVGVGVVLIVIVVKNTSAGQAVASKAKSVAGAAAFL